VYHAIHDYCTVDLSAFYYDVLKDRLYTKAPNNPLALRADRHLQNFQRAHPPRRAHPRLTAEEIWRYLPKSSAAPTPSTSLWFPEKAELRTGIAPRSVTMELLTKVRAEVLKLLKLRATKENQFGPRSQSPSRCRP